MTEGLSALFIQRRRSNSKCPTDGGVNSQTNSYVHTFTRDILSAIYGWRS